MTQARQSYAHGRWHCLQRTAVQEHPGLLATLVPDAEDKS
jgi:hypothetical protein